MTKASLYSPRRCDMFEKKFSSEAWVEDMARTRACPSVAAPVSGRCFHVPSSLFAPEWTGLPGQLVCGASSRSQRDH